MKKVIIILAAAAVVSGGCGQARQPKTADSHIAENQNTTTMKLSQNNRLNEKWHFETNDRENFITVSHTFHESGTYEYRRSETFDHYTQNAHGIYYYQPETNEIFIHIDESFENSITGLYAPMRNFKQYIKILDFNDKSVVVATWGIEWWYGLHWDISENGKYKLIEPQNVETTERTYQRQILTTNR
jgi:hypothetical protein